MINYGYFFEQFEPGMLIKHEIAKTIFESDNNLFSLLTMNHHPVHLDQEYASHNHHGKILVVGTLVFSLAVGLTVGVVSGKAVANLNYEDIQHEGPVFIGDTIRVETEVLSKRLSKSRKDAGIVYVESRVFNQSNQRVLKFRRNVLVKKKVEC